MAQQMQPMAIGSSSSSAAEQNSDARFQPVGELTDLQEKQVRSTEARQDPTHTGNPHRRFLLCTAVVAGALFFLGMFVSQNTKTTPGKASGNLDAPSVAHPANGAHDPPPPSRVNFIGVGRFGDAVNETSTGCLPVNKVSGGATGGHCAGVFRSHEGIYRNVTYLRNGVETVTYSTDKRKVRELNGHVRMMTMMVRMGHKIHQHDPLFDRMFSSAWKSKIVTKLHTLANGVKVTQTSDDDCAVQLIHFHARAVSLFVHNGLDEFRCKHTLPKCAQ